MKRYSVLAVLMLMVAVLAGCEGDSTFVAPEMEPEPDPTMNVSGQFSGEWTVIFNVGDHNGLVECAGEATLERGDQAVAGQTTREDSPGDNCTNFQADLHGSIDPEANLELNFPNLETSQVYHRLTSCEYVSGESALKGQVRGDHLELATSGVVTCGQEEFPVDIEFSGRR